MGNMGEAIFSIVAGITGVAVLSVILSRNSNTAGVLQAASQGYSSMLATALSPINGATGIAGGGSIY